MESNVGQTRTEAKVGLITCINVSVYVDLLYMYNYNKHYGSGKFEDCVSQ